VLACITNKRAPPPPLRLPVIGLTAAAVTTVPRPATTFRQRNCVPGLSRYSEIHVYAHRIPRRRIHSRIVPKTASVTRWAPPSGSRRIQLCWRLDRCPRASGRVMSCWCAGLTRRGGSESDLRGVSAVGLIGPRDYTLATPVTHGALSLPLVRDPVAFASRDGCLPCAICLDEWVTCRCFGSLWASARRSPTGPGLPRAACETPPSRQARGRAFVNGVEAMRRVSPPPRAGAPSN
jgi:hypothetical protein